MNIPRIVRVFDKLCGLTDMGFTYIGVSEKVNGLKLHIYKIVYKYDQYQVCIASYDTGIITQKPPYLVRYLECNDAIFMQSSDAHNVHDVLDALTLYGYVPAKAKQREIKINSLFD